MYGLTDGCPICATTTKMSSVRVLPCLHACCGTCFQAMLDSHVTPLLCPRCRRPFKDGGIELTRLMSPTELSRAFDAECTEVRRRKRKKADIGGLEKSERFVNTALLEWLDVYKDEEVSDDGTTHQEHVQSEIEHDIEVFVIFNL